MDNLDFLGKLASLPSVVDNLCKQNDLLTERMEAPEPRMKAQDKRIEMLEKTIETQEKRSEKKMQTLEKRIETQDRTIDVLRNAQVKLETRLVEAETGNRHEKHYQRLLEERLGGKHLSIPGVGITDVTTDDQHVEIKRWTRYHEVQGQLEKYQRAAHRPQLAVYFFGVRPKPDRIATIERSMAYHKIAMYSFDIDDNIFEHQPAQDIAHYRRKEEVNPIIEFLAARTRPMPSAKIHVIHFKRAYTDWTKGCNILTTTKLTAYLIAAGQVVTPDKVHAKCCSGNLRAVVGLALLESS